MKNNILLGITVVMLLLGCTLPVAASDSTLGIFGNANEDDTIDIQDVTKTELIILKYSNKTELADAKYDDKINIQDVTQTELIILGQEKELTIIDEADRIVTVHKPVGRVITLGGYDAEIMWLIGAQDKIVGIANWMAEKSYYDMCMPGLTKLPTVGSGKAIDYETVITLNPDLVITWHYYAATIDEKIPKSMPVTSFDLFVPESLTEGVVKFGYIFGKRDAAEHYIDDFHDKHIDFIKVRTEELSEEERPKVYLERHDMPYKTYGSDSYAHQGIHIAGGKNIFADVEAGQFVADAEDVVMKNPDIIIKYASTGGLETGYDIDDASKAKAMRDEIMSRPELAEVNAVKEGRVYIMNMGLNCGPGYPIANAYWAKWFQPELFVDLDPNAIHKEYLSSQGIEFNLDEHGVFVYHPEEHPCVIG
ncbi:MAG: ABC transporter substrate-binding protein [Deltaproteobacteria bacterium]|nr:ABC transporter substrate-binding protein [Deltaproteobacteria bacterium]